MRTILILNLIIIFSFISLVIIIWVKSLNGIVEHLNGSLTGAHPSWQLLKPINLSNKNLFSAINVNTKLITMFLYFREALVRDEVNHGFSIISK